MYEEKKKDKSFSAEEAKRESAKNELQRYMWYYERYAGHGRSNELAVKLMPVIKSKMDMLHRLKNYPPAELEFLKEGCETVIKCHHVLKWTYVYGYYRDNQMSAQDKNLFQMWQSDLEKYCDHLHGLVERNLDEFLDDNMDSRQKFSHYRGDLISYFQSTGRFCKNLVEGLEHQEAN